MQKKSQKMAGNKQKNALAGDMQKNANICRNNLSRQICKNMQKKCKYVHRYAGICKLLCKKIKNKDRFSKNMQEICKKYALANICNKTSPIPRQPGPGPAPARTVRSQVLRCQQLWLPTVCVGGQTQPLARARLTPYKG